MSTIAEELRGAAARLREAAKNATPGPWQSYSGRVDASGATVAMAVAGYSDSEWIALAAPTLAEPLAVWLSAFATWYEETTTRGGDPIYHAVDECSAEVDNGCGCFADALKVARALAGVAS